MCSYMYLATILLNVQSDTQVFHLLDRDCLPLSAVSALLFGLIPIEAKPKMSQNQVLAIADLVVDYFGLIYQG